MDNDIVAGRTLVAALLMPAMLARAEAARVIDPAAAPVLPSIDTICKAADLSLAAADLLIAKAVNA